MKSMAALVAACLFTLSAAADYSEEQAWSFELEEGGWISLENVNGNVDVTGGSGDRVEITAVKKAGSEEYLQHIEIVIDRAPDSLRIETRHPDRGSRRIFGWGRDAGGSVDFTLSVPAGIHLDAVESVNGVVSVAGVTGTVRAGTVNGDVTVSDLAGDAKLETVNGSVDARFLRLAGEQKASCESVNGRVTVQLPADADVSVSAETINGGIDGGDFGLKVNKGFVGRELDGRIGQGSARLELNTVNGSIRIRKG